MGEHGRDSLKDHGMFYVLSNQVIKTKVENLSTDSFTKIDLRHVFLCRRFSFPHYKQTQAAKLQRVRWGSVICQY